MKILDMTAGNRAIWFDKHHPDATFTDLRESVSPDAVVDWTDVHTSSVGNHYSLVVFDPPHVNFGKNAEMSKTYGYHTTEDIRNFIRCAAREAHLITDENALMAFKWNDHDQKLDRVLGLMSKWWEPLFGHKTAMRTKHSSATYWVMLRRRGAA